MYPSYLFYSTYYNITIPLRKFLAVKDPTQTYIYNQLANKAPVLHLGFLVGKIVEMKRCCIMIG